MTNEQNYVLAQPRYHRLIRQFARQHYAEIPGYAPEDLEQELREVLWKVVTSYDPNRGSKFNSHFWQCVRNRQIDLVKRAQVEKRKSEWFAVMIEELDPDSVSQVAQALETADWQDLSSLTPEDWCLLRETVVERMKTKKRKAA